ncbi:MAG: sugar phosphate nucleotidyltransferase [Acidobacteriota bacterium]
MPAAHDVIPLVMAGGFGTRIRPLSANRPKPLLPVVNRSILARMLASLVRSGFGEAVLLTYYESGAIRSAFGDGASSGLRLHYLVADRDHGTAGAVARGAALRPADTYLAVSSDIVCDFDLAGIVEAHRRSGSRASVVATRVSNPLQLGILILDETGRVRRFVEKPSWGEVFSDTANAGIFVLSHEAIDLIPKEEPTDFAHDFFPRLLAQGVELHGVLAEGYWRDVGDPDAYLDVHRDFFDRRLHLDPPGVSRMSPGCSLWLEGPSTIDPSAELRGTVVIGPGCTVGPGARLEDVVIGPGTRIAARADLRRVVTWEEVEVGPGSRIEGAVLASRVQIGQAATVETGAIIADGSVLGRDTRVKEGVRIWPGKTVEDHAVVHANLVHADRWRTSTFDEGAVTGLTNLELTPEVAARLGAAYGTLLPQGSTVLSVRDAHPASRMLRRAFVGGVGSAGLNMIDLGLLPVPVMRYRLEALREVGGVSFHQVPLVRGFTSIHFFDGCGLDISTSFAKSVERVFLREEFRRVQHEEVGVILDQPGILQTYADAYLAALDLDLLRRRRFSLVVDYANSPAVVVLPRLLAELGCEVVTLNAQTEGSREALLPEEIALAHRRLATIVRSLEADLGVWLGPTSENLVLIGRRGEVWSGLDVTALLIAAVVAGAAAPSDVVLPPFAPSTFELALRSAGHRVRPTLATPRALTEASRRPGVLLATGGEGDWIFPAFHHAPDALFGIGRFLELVARSDRSLDELSADAPPVPVASVEVSCPSERKGEVMRRFSEAFRGRELSFLEGVKVALDGGWVLLRPDRTSPRLRFHAEAATRERAAELLAAHLDLVEGLVRGEA